MKSRASLLVALISLSLIALELVWTRIFSAEFFYTFAFLVLSLAILGLGLGALALRLLPVLDRDSLLPWHLALAGLATLAGPILVFRLGLDFAQLAFDPAMIGLFLVAVVLLAAPFFFGGAALAMIFKRCHREMPRVYMADLIGAGVGVAAILWLMNLLGTPVATFLCALPVLLAALVAGRGWAKVVPAGLAVIAVALSPSAAGLLEAERDERAPVIYKHWDAMAKIKLFDYAGQARGINIDNVANSPVYLFDGNFDDPEVEDAQWGIDVSWLIDRFDACTFLSLGSGGGTDVLQALAEGAAEVHAVEVNPHINRMMLEGDPSGYIEEEPAQDAVPTGAVAAAEDSGERSGESGEATGEGSSESRTAEGESAEEAAEESSTEGGETETSSPAEPAAEGPTEGDGSDEAPAAGSAAGGSTGEGGSDGAPEATSAAEGPGGEEGSEGESSGDEGSEEKGSVQEAPPGTAPAAPPRPVIRNEAGEIITLAEFSGRIYMDPRVRVISEDARAYIRRHENRFDLIYSLSSNTWAALASGSFALAESYLFTKEAFKDYWKALSEDGFLSMEHQVYMPRLVSALIEALEELGVEDPGAHFAVYDLPQMRRNLLLLSKQPLTDEIRQNAYGGLTEEKFEAIHLLYPAPEGLEENLINRIVTEGWENVADSAPIDISPPTDDRPFVAQMGLWKNFQWDRLERLSGYADFQGFPLSKAVIATVLAVVVLLILPLNLAPYLRKGRRLRAIPWLYFFAIGVAFMSVEVVLIQKYALFIGAPVYSIATVLLTLLIASGIGSRFSRDVSDGVAFAGILVWVALDIFLFGRITESLAGLALFPRLLVTGVLIAPLGFFMGMPFPKGTLRVGDLIDWGFAVNGAASVLGATGIVVVAFTFGFTTALLVGALLYLAAFGLIALRRGWQEAPAAA